MPDSEETRFEKIRARNKVRGGLFKGLSGQLLPVLVIALSFGIISGAGAIAAERPAYLDRPPSDDVIYFVLPDRFENGDAANDQGGVDGGRLDHGFDPTHKGFYHGGDLKGLTQRLDYIQGLGATAIWLGPIYKNKPVQGPAGEETAGYHGYWITDFTSVDPHFGTEADLKEFITEAHARDIKIYLDIITNHTADVIQYRECHDPEYDGPDKAPACPYRSKADYPYTTRGGVNGARINNGFDGDQTPFQTTTNFKNLTQADFAYTPFVPADEKDIKVPSWLNNPIYYHNRSNSVWVGESGTYGDFAGLDDLMTEHPRVVDGMISIFKDWISNYKIDGFRIDTAKHINPEFWQAFVPAILDHAKQEGIPNFYVFGEAYSPNPAELARFTRIDGFPFVLDFGFQSVVQQVVAEGAPAIRLADFFGIDSLYDGGAKTALGLPVFIGNHDMGRFAMFVRQKNPDANERELLKRTTLAHAMMFFLRGAPVIYYGDEQGFNGDGNDQASREDMFESRVASYNDNNLIGSDETTADSNFNQSAPLFKAIAEMASLHKKHSALRSGVQLIRRADHDGGILAVSRLMPEGGEYLVVFNASGDDRDVQVETDPRSSTWRSLYGRCDRRQSAAASVRVRIKAWGYLVCQSNKWTENQ